MKVKVTGKNDNWFDQDYFTVGKTYQARWVKPHVFQIIKSDEGETRTCRFEDCPHGFTYEEVAV